MCGKVEWFDEDLNPLKPVPMKMPKVCAMPILEVKISELARYKIHAQAKLVTEIFEEDLETFSFLLGTELGVIIDTLMPKQYVDPSYTGIKTYEDLSSISDELDKINKERIKYGKEPLRIVGWAHSHGSMNVFMSNIDHDEHKQLISELMFLEDDMTVEIDGSSTFYIVSLTVNNCEDEKPYVYQVFPCGKEKIYKMDDGVKLKEFKDGVLEKKKILNDMVGEIKEKVRTRDVGGKSIYKSKDNYMISCNDDNEGKMSGHSKKNDVDTEDIIKFLKNLDRDELLQEIGGMNNFYIKFFPRKPIRNLVDKLIYRIIELIVCKINGIFMEKKNAVILDYDDINSVLRSRFFHPDEKG